ncbi:MAG: cache domain-containing protein [Thermodesulfobacteriota bacterium]|nr:cache domain-containing protein [Thermodesulfobacteriota bacterium]
MRLKIGAKVNLLMVSALILVGGAALFFSVAGLKHGGQVAIEEYETGVMTEKKNYIRDLVGSAYTIAEQFYRNAMDREVLKKEFGKKIKAAVDQAACVFEFSLNNENLFTMEEKKKYARTMIENMTWGEDNQGYFWIQDTQGDMVMHPTKPKLNGQYLLDIKDPDGKLLFKAFQDIALEKGSGLVDYKWPKPGFDKPVDKISYVKLFKEWGWIIGGGMYLESTEALLKHHALKSMGAVRYGKNKTGYFFVFDSQGTCLLHDNASLVGTNMYDIRDKKNNFFIRDLINAAASSDQGAFFNYFRPKPGSDTALAKLSFAKRLDGWDWHIGTGIYTDDLDAAIARKADFITESISSDIVRIVSIVAGIIVLALILSWFVVSKGVVNPIRNVVDMLKDIARGEGDLTRRIEDKSGDETQELAEWFNTFIENMQAMISSVKEDAIKLNDSLGSLAGISDQMNSAAEETASRANTVAAASEEMSTNMDSIAAAMEETSTNVNMVASASEEMTSTINEIAQNAEKARAITDNAVNQTQTASNEVNELGDAARQIGKVVESITDISEQVNLLALNATIEAARAGEAGKGFAVVANEIKDLASQTAGATNEIKDRVAGIQTSTEATVSNISNISAAVSEINEMVSTIATAVEEQSATTKEISENVSQASTGLGEVNENVAQASTAASEVSKEVAEVTQSSGEMANSSSQVKISAQELAGLADKLSDMMKKFKV